MRGSCHHLSMWLNCLIGHPNDITSITKKLLITYTFLLLTLLCSSLTPYASLWVREGALYLVLSLVSSPLSSPLIGTAIVLAYRWSGLLLATVQPLAIVLHLPIVLLSLLIQTYCLYCLYSVFQNHPYQTNPRPKTAISFILLMLKT